MIKKLPKSVSDKIAAGEVIERPLSVVKELVENAIDASASAISIGIMGGGISRINVTDNGCGIGADEAALAFEKHATSKIATERDLFLITTQGFRGEALSSIAAVSAVEMNTKKRDEELGIQIRITADRAATITPAGLPDGTSVTVSNLFYNVPARLKFLKSEAKEAAFVSDLIARYILAFPEIAFHYTSAQKTIYHSPGNGSLLDAIYCVYGGALMDNIVYVEHETGGTKVSGYVSRAGTVMKNRQKGSIFVNRRFVRSTALSDMVRGAYGETLIKGEYPFYALNITMPAGSVDVNVHPNKLQVRFADAAAVEHVIKEAVSTACRHVRGSIITDVETQPPQRISNVQMRAPEDVLQTALFTGFSKTTLSETEAAYEEESRIGCTYQAAAQQTPQPMPEPSFSPPSYRLIGSFADTYILIEQSENLMIIDQHAAHERLLYERFASQKQAASQTLIAPLVQSVSHAHKNLIDENLEMLNALGFEIEPFGALEYKIDAVPAITAAVDPATLFFDAVGEIESHRGDVVLLREAVIRAACKSAVKARDKLPESALLELVNHFLESNVMPTCPHGRPVITLLTKKQLEKSFKRI